MKSTTAKNGRPIFTAAKKNNYDWVWSNDDYNPSSCEDGGGAPPERELSSSTKLKYMFFGAMLSMVLLAFAVIGVYMVRCNQPQSTLVVVSDHGTNGHPDDFYGPRTIPNITWETILEPIFAGGGIGSGGTDDYEDEHHEDGDEDGGAHHEDGESAFDESDYGDSTEHENDVVISNQTIVIFENGTAIRQKRYVYDGALSDSSSNDVVITGNVHVSSGSAVISTIGNWSKSDD